MKYLDFFEFIVAVFVEFCPPRFEIETVELEKGASNANNKLLELSVVEQ